MIEGIGAPSVFVRSMKSTGISDPEVCTGVSRSCATSLPAFKHLAVSALHTFSFVSKFLVGPTHAQVEGSSQRRLSM